MAGADKPTYDVGNPTGPAEARYNELAPHREPFLRRARECSELTIPALIPPQGWSGHEDLYTPFQSIGARGVNNLAAKFLLTLFPANRAFFRYAIDEYAADEAGASEGGKSLKTEIEKALAKMERRVVFEVETTAARVPFFEAIKHMIVGGNILVFIAPDSNVRVFHLSRYVVSRDPMGNPLEIVVKEDLSPLVLQAMYPEFYVEVQQRAESDEKTCGLYTHIRREAKKWVVYQEVKGLRVPGSEGSYRIDTCPWIPLRFTRIDGESYGRGYVEEYLGDLKSLESLSQTLVEGAAACAKMLFLVDPNGSTSKDAVTKSRNGDVVAGNAADVTVLQAEKFADFRVAKDTTDSIEHRLSLAFLLNTAIQRNGERVTAEEIRYMAGELEDALGGVYSILSRDFQLPYVTVLTHQMEKRKKLPPLPKGSVKPMIVSGLEALGRGHDLNKLDAFVQNPLGPEATAANIHVNEYMQRRAVALDIPADGLVKTAQEVAAEQQAQMQQNLMQTGLEKLGPEAMKMAGASAMKGSNEPGQPAA